MRFLLPIILIALGLTLTNCKNRVVDKKSTRSVDSVVVRSQSNRDSLHLKALKDSTRLNKPYKQDTVKKMK